MDFRSSLRHVFTCYARSEVSVSAGDVVNVF